MHIEMQPNIVQDPETDTDYPVGLNLHKLKIIFKKADGVEGPIKVKVDIRACWKHVRTTTSAGSTTTTERAIGGCCVRCLMASKIFCNTINS